MSGTTASWFVVVRADCALYEARGHPRAVPVGRPTEPSPSPADEVTIGRRSESLGTAPAIDLAGPPEDGGVSHRHASLVPRRRRDLGFLVDHGTTNGTGDSTPPGPPRRRARGRAPRTPRSTATGCAVGLWTRIDIRAGEARGAVAAPPSAPASRRCRPARGLRLPRRALARRGPPAGSRPPCLSPPSPRAVCRQQRWGWAGPAGTRGGGPAGRRCARSGGRRRPTGGGEPIALAADMDANLANHLLVGERAIFWAHPGRDRRVLRRAPRHRDRPAGHRGRQRPRRCASGRRRPSCSTGWGPSRPTPRPPGSADGGDAAAALAAYRQATDLMHDELLPAGRAAQRRQRRRADGPTTTPHRAPRAGWRWSSGSAGAARAARRRPVFLHRAHRRLLNPALLLATLLAAGLLGSLVVVLRGGAEDLRARQPGRLRLGPRPLDRPLGRVRRQRRREPLPDRPRPRRRL